MHEGDFQTTLGLHALNKRNPRAKSDNVEFLGIQIVYISRRCTNVHESGDPACQQQLNVRQNVIALFNNKKKFEVSRSVIIDSAGVPGSDSCQPIGRSGLEGCKVVNFKESFPVSMDLETVCATGKKKF